MTPPSSIQPQARLEADLTEIRVGLERFRTEGRWRRRYSRQGPPGAVLRYDGRELDNFASNDYLGLSSHPHLAKILGRAALEWGVGSGAAALLSGYCEEHKRMEEELASWLRRDRCLLFSTGYMANLAVVPALAGRGDLVVLERACHASLYDAVRLSGATLRRFRRHREGDLEKILAREAGRRRLVLCEGVFSMDGDIAPLMSLAKTCARYGSWLLVDDAHGFGVLGAEGRGTLELLGLEQEQVPLLMGTFGKALGCFGAFIAGREELLDRIAQLGRSFIYTTALPPALAAAARAALALVREEGWRRQRLANRVSYLEAGLARLPVTQARTHTAIQPLLLGSNEAALTASKYLLDRGILAPAIRPPTVSRGSARLRLSLNAEHEEAQLGRLLEALAGLVQENHPGVALSGKAGRRTRPKPGSAFVDTPAGVSQPHAPSGLNPSPATSEPPRGPGPPLVLLPGWAFQSDIWDSLCRSLPAGLSVWRPELPDYDEAPDLPGIARYLAPRLPPGALLIGWSLGGLVALATALEAERRPGPDPGGVLLIASSPSLVQRPGWPHAIAPTHLKALAELLQVDREAALRRFVRLVGQGGRPATRQLLQRCCGRGLSKESLAAGLELLRHSDLRTAPARLRCSLRLLLGARDPLVPPACLARFPGTDHVLLEDCGHAPFLDAPGRVARHIIAFATQLHE